MDHSEPSLKQLLRQAKQGDAVALQQLLARMQPHVELAARQFADPRHPDAGVSDLVQEAQVAMWQHLPEFAAGQSTSVTQTHDGPSPDRNLSPDGESESPRERQLVAWIRQIVRHLGIDRRRAANAQRRHPQAGIVSLDAPLHGNNSPPPVAANSQTSPSSAAARHESDVRIADTLAQLDDPLDQRLVQLVFVEGHSLRQTAATLQLTYDQVRYRFRQVLKRLEQSLRGL